MLASTPSNTTMYATPTTSVQRMKRLRHPNNDTYARSARAESADARSEHGEHLGEIHSPARQGPDEHVRQRLILDLVADHARGEHERRQGHERLRDQVEGERLLRFL